MSLAHLEYTGELRSRTRLKEERDALKGEKKLNEKNQRGSHICIYAPRPLFKITKKRGFQPLYIPHPF